MLKRFFVSSYENYTGCAETGKPEPTVGSPEPSSEPSAPSQPVVTKDDVKTSSTPSAPIAVQHFKAPDVPSTVKPAVPTAETPEATKKHQAVVDVPSTSVPDVTSSVPAAPADTSSTLEEQPDTDGKEKKSRFGLPSFMSSSGRKSKKERPTGVQPNMILLLQSVEMRAVIPVLLVLHPVYTIVP